MKTQNSTLESSQKVLIGSDNAITNPLRAAKIKIHQNISKINQKLKISRALFTDENNKENISPAKPHSMVLQSSKKIQKSDQKSVQSGRKALTDITNYFQSPSENRESPMPSTIPSTISSASSKGREPKIEKLVFIEDEILETSNYVTLTYVNRKTRKPYQFHCFHEDDLGLPKEFAIKTITHSCDNDCSTDDDQIRGAINRTYKALESYVKEQKQIEALAKRP